MTGVERLFISWPGRYNLGPWRQFYQFAVKDVVFSKLMVCFILYVQNTDIGETIQNCLKLLQPKL